MKIKLNNIMRNSAGNNEDYKSTVTSKNKSYLLILVILVVKSTNNENCM